MVESEVSFETVYENTLAALAKDRDGELERLLWDIVKWRRENPRREGVDGFEWHEVHGDPRTLNSLVTKRILSITFKSNKSTYYVPTNVEAIEKALLDYGSTSQVVKEHEGIPADLFSIIVGHEDKKDILFRALNSDRPVHVLMVGSVATAKTLFLEELRRLPGSTFRLGSRLSKAGLYDILFSEKPRYLLLDELDKIEDQSNVAALLSLMQDGRIVETLHNKTRSTVLRTWVFASANREDKIPVELRSRFVVLRFSEYTPEEFLEVASKVLVVREGVEPGIADYIARQVLYRMRSRDVRDAIKVARLLYRRTKQEVDHVISILSAQR
jgi:Holliday junction DNA helicase RuvB